MAGVAVEKKGQHRNERRADKVATASRGRSDALGVASATLLVLALVLLATSSHATTYKWIDDQGVVHYTDKIPLEAINKGNVELDKQGVPVRKTDPALTPEQRKARADDEARRKQLAKERDVVERRDRALLGTYTTEGEIDLARNRAISTIDAQVQSSTAYIATLSKRKLELDSRKAALGDKPVPAVLERELANISSELGRQADLIAAKQKEIVIATARYDADKKRWKELRAAAAAEAATNATPNVVPTTARQ
jgi:hypothetical protein